MRRGDRVQRAGRLIVGDVVTAAADQGVVFLAPHRLSNTEFRIASHDCPYFARFAWPLPAVRAAIQRDTT